MNARGHGRIRLVGLFGVAAFLVLGMPVVATAQEQSLTFDPTSAHVGDPIILRGTGWLPSDGPVSVFLPGDDPKTADPWIDFDIEDGTFDEPATVPPLPAGLHEFFACQACDTAGDTPPQDDASLTVTPALHLAQTHGIPGDTVGITGDGWSPSRGVVKVFASEEESADETNILTLLEPQPDGTLVPGTFQVPARDPGPTTLFACQLCPEKPEGPSAKASFEITEVSSPVETQTLALDHQSAAPGDELTASGTGWSDTAGDVSVYADEAAMRAGEDPLGGAPSIGGAFTTPVTVPQTDTSPLVMYACQHCGESDLEATYSLEIGSGVELDPQLTVIPSSGRVGSEFRVIGTGWEDEPVGLFMRLPDAKTGTRLGPVPTEGGAFDETFTVPELRMGPVVIHGCQECLQSDRQTYDVAFAVVAAAQDPPTLLVDPTSAKPGDSVRVTGTGWLRADGVVTVYVDPEGTSEPTAVWRHLTPRADGTISSGAEVPDSDAGDYRVYACQRCRDTVSFPYQTAALEIEGGGRDLGPLVVVVVVVAAGIWWLRRKPTTNGDKVEHAPAPSPELRADPFPDPTLDVEVRTMSDRGVPHAWSDLDVVTRLDPADLTDRVEVTSWRTR